MFKNIISLYKVSLGVLIIIIITEITTSFQISHLDMLPAKYFALIIATFVLIDILISLLIFRKSDSQGNKKHTFSRILGYTLSVLMIIGLIFLGQAIEKVQETVTSVTQEAEISAVVDFYVLKDNPASKLEDASGYSLAVTESFDWENTKTALASIEEQELLEISTATYSTVFAMVDALYAKEVDGLLLNSAYVDILEEMELYADFTERVKNIWSYNVHEVVSDVEEIPVQEEVKEDDDTFVMYLSGSDTRSKVLKTSRSDVNILAVVNTRTHQVLLINTPRDYYIGNPAGGGALDKLTHCGIYGVECSMGALEELYNEESDYYGQINFTGFEMMIDAVGGVDVYSEVAFTTPYGNHKIKQGMNHLNGAEALGFARDRYSLKGGDNARGKNQMKIIAALIDKMSASNIVTNYTEILESLQGMFVTNITSEEISALVKMQLSDMPNWDVKSYAVTGRGDSARTYSMPGMNAYVMRPNQETVERAIELIDKVVSGEVLIDEDVR